MARLTLFLLGALYLCVAAILGVLLARGGSLSLGVAGFVGGFGTLLAVHSLIARSLDN